MSSVIRQKLTSTYGRLAEDIAKNLEKHGFYGKNLDDELARQISLKQQGIETTPVRTHEPEIEYKVPNTTDDLPSTKGARMIPYEGGIGPEDRSGISPDSIRIYDHAPGQKPLDTFPEETAVDTARSPISKKALAAALTTAGAAGVGAYKYNQSDVESGSKEPSKVAQASDDDTTPEQKSLEMQIKEAQAEAETARKGFTPTAFPFERELRKMGEYQEPDQTEGRTRTEGQIAERRAQMAEERRRADIGELATMIGQSLARYGAAREGQSKGVYIDPSTVDFGKGIDYNAIRDSARKDYLHDIGELRDLQAAREKETSAAAKHRYDTKIDILRMKVQDYARQQGEFTSLDKAEKYREAREKERQLRDKLTASKEKQASNKELLRAITDQENSLETAKHGLEKLQTVKMDNATADGIIKSAPRAELEAYGITPSWGLGNNKDEAKELIGKRLEDLNVRLSALQARRAEVLAGTPTRTTTPTGVSTTAQASAKTETPTMIRVRHKSGAEKLLTPEQYKQLMSQPNAGEFEKQ